MGRPATKLVVCLLDTLASSVACSNYTEGCTPARQKNVIRFLKTPLVETELDPFDEVDNLVGEGGLAERLGVTPTDTPTARLPAYPRFRCSSDFNEGSPVCRSRDKDARTGGRTLVSASEAHTPDTSDQNIQQILREVRSRDVEQEEMIKTKKTKRCLTKDVDAAAREKMGLDPKRKNSDNDTKKKEPAKKRKISTPKGQKKLTSFFMR